MIGIFVNGKPVQVQPGVKLLVALERAGVHVPHLCHDERLAPAGACRLCSVEIGEAAPVPACTIEVREGMQVWTHAPELEAHRRTTLTELARRLPARVPEGALRQPARVQEASDDSPFLRELRHYGLLGELGADQAPGPPVDDSHPYIRVDMSRCVHCFRCERICAELQGQFTWQAWNRGAALRFVPDSGTTLRESSCVSCGACADTCPSGAIEDKTLHALDPATDFTRTTCPYCGVGCEMLVGTRAGRIVQVRPALDAKVNKGHLCVKGRYAFGFTHASDRVTSPMIRRDGALEPVSWEEALAHVAQRFRALLTAHGPSAIGVLGSARATNEENYLTQKFARVVLGTNNVDCCARVCHAPSAAALGAMLGTGAATSSFDDIERAQTLLVFGANATENHPIVGARIRQAALHGAHLIVVDPRRTELAQLAALHLQLRPGTDIPLLNGLASALVSEQLVDRAFIAERVAEWESYRSFIEAWAPERVASVCGVAADLIRKAARLYATHSPALSVHGLGITEHVQGTEAVMCLVNLALLTGNVGRPGAGVNPLRGQNNVQGSAHMGCEPHHLTGYATLDQGRERFERVWQAPVPTARGLDLMEMQDAAHAGKLRALYAIGYDVLLTNPDAKTTREALSRLDFLVVQDLFLTETARELASVFLPAASSFEKDGTFMNAERRIQRVRAAVSAPGEARSDAQILCQLAAALDHARGFTFADAEEIWNEVRAVWPQGAGISYARLAQHGLQWPCPSEDHPGTPLLHAAAFALGPRAALRRIEYRATPETTNAEYPLLLMTGRRLYQFNAGTMTARTPNNELQPEDVLDISPEDASVYGLKPHDEVRLKSRHGEAKLRVSLVDTVRPGQLFATFHTAKVFLNHVTSSERDNITRTPEYKVTAVQLFKI